MLAEIVQAAEPSQIEKYAALVFGVLSLLIALKKRWDELQANDKASKAEKVAQVVILGVEEAAKLLPRDLAKQTKGAIQSVAAKEGLEPVLSEKVGTLTKPERRAVDENGKPIMPKVGG